MANSLGILQYLPWALFSALRAYALSSEARGKWFISTLVLLSSLAPLIINYVQLGYWSITVGVCLISSDLLVMCITWKATYKTSREIKVLGQGTSLSSILFRNGTLYFGILAMLNILHLSSTLFSIFNGDRISYQNDPTSIIVLFSEPLTAILVSRFLMDLQEASNAATHQHSHISSMSTLHFSRVIGSLGSSLPAPGETSEVQSVPQENDGEIEMERVDNGLVA
ncbi:hypothetical protein C8Q74DRAFT_840811 [Fomes fomentarius]|nr:hypothetical protein C8Q74DRAFT_840811 [Fomes fomentarius]